MAIQTSEAPLWIVILRNVLISAIAGILAGCFLFPLFAAIIQAIEKDNYALFNFKFLFLTTLTSPVLIIYILPFLLPLVAMACALGVLFQKSIQRHLMLWCCLAPILVWLAAIAVVTRLPVNNFYEQFTWLERFFINIPSTDHLIFLIAPTFSSFVFYKLCEKGFKW